MSPVPLLENRIKTIVFSNESRFSLRDLNDLIRIGRRTCELLHPSWILKRNMVPTPGLLVRSAICYHSSTQLLFHWGTLNDIWYSNNNILPFIVPFVTPVDNDVFQQDNARTQTARSTQHALWCVSRLMPPTHPLDLYPVEYIWDTVEQWRL